MQELICALCGEKIDEMDDDYEELADGRIVCWTCYRSKCRRCIGCNELFLTEEMINVEFDDYCCKPCYEGSLSVCDVCGKPVSRYLMEYVFIDDKHVCPDCHKSRETTATMPQYTLQDLLQEYRENRKNS